MFTVQQYVLTVHSVRLVVNRKMPVKVYVNGQMVAKSHHAATSGAPDWSIGYFYVPACFEGRAEVVRLLLAYPGVDANATDVVGDAPLNCACSEGHAAVVRLPRPGGLAALSAGGRCGGARRRRARRATGCVTASPR